MVGVMSSSRDTCFFLVRVRQYELRMTISEWQKAVLTDLVCAAQCDQCFRLRMNCKTPRNLQMLLM